MRFINPHAAQVHLEGYDAMKLDTLGLRQTRRNANTFVSPSPGVDPKVIVADEAVSALEVSIKAQVCTLLKDLQQNLNLPFSSFPTTWR